MALVSAAPRQSPMHMTQYRSVWLSMAHEKALCAQNLASGQFAGK